MLTDDEDEDAYEMQSDSDDPDRSYDAGNKSTRNALIVSQSRTGVYKPKMNPKSPDSDDDDMKIFSRGRDHFLNDLTSRTGLEGSILKNTKQEQHHVDVGLGEEQARSLAYDLASASITKTGKHDQPKKQVNSANSSNSAG
mmetsp:Transcript_7494/g.10628  ORF Transcript_7494/g.10628 Transcript_7494/m.10628 type:complete len:141 (-) Transcript_7494:109-531(-)|eukprot:CAMPEP_0185575818 /NCGR_PEP_ID=MMETSP0434-20130131/6903_1 /TAXON_ID=626734 ORGANISM="Favella taraikaensis, Strain Fe Narragansett Bay" /NCGR_SAMPLE_ID=MMETSP0434 /ASSEMBLY_ACC=CAM_ASM_000379 /LENGTH=140 /DNA_ID=CAMNT_0028192805 /DNA_START=1811 /DNA_END=2233 /DNA_ORIENTATION=+